MHWKTNISQFIRVCKTPSSRFTTLWPLQVVITLTSVSLFTRLSLLVVVFFFILACFVLFLSTASISQLPNVLLQVEKPEMQWNSQFSLWYIYINKQRSRPETSWNVTKNMALLFMILRLSDHFHSSLYPSASQLTDIFP